MNLEINPEIAATIRRKVEDGRYPSENAVVEAALELLERRDVGLADLRASIERSVEQFDRGEGLSYASSDDFLASIKATAQKLDAGRHSIS